MILAAALALASCQPQMADWTVNDPLEGFMGQCELASFNWQQGDVVSLYSESELGQFSARYVAQTAGQSTSFKPYAYSTAAQKADNFYACFPAEHINFTKGGGTIPAEYDCEDALFRDIPQCAIKKNDAVDAPGVMNFKPSANVIELAFSSNEDFVVKSITLTSDVNLSGTGRYRLDKGGAPYISIAQGTNSVKYNYAGVKVNGTTTFTMVIPANITLAELSIAVESENGKVLNKTFSGFEAGIGQVYQYRMVNPVVFQQKIYESDTYTSFVDLVWYNDRYYCAFRDGQNHVPSNYNEKFGEIRILESKDCRTWTDVLLLTDAKYDMRDPHFCIAQDGSLLCYYAYHLPDESWVKPSKTIVSILKQEGEALVEKSRHNVDAGEVYSRYWIWNITRHEDKIYGVGYYTAGTNVAFLVSDDGINFTHISDIPFLGNEASVNIIDGKAYVLMRNQSDVGNASMAVADAPYTSWEVTSMNYGLHSPVGVEYNGKLYLCGRKYADKTRDGVSLFSYKLPKDTKLKEEYRLPCDRPTADNAYPGLCLRDGALRIVYYSIPTGKWVPDIYYYEIPVELLDENN